MLELKKSFEVTRNVYHRKIFFKLVRGCIICISSIYFFIQNWRKREEVLNNQKLSKKLRRQAIERNLFSIINAVIILYEAYKLNYLFRPNHGDVVLKMLIEDLRGNNILNENSYETFKKFLTIK